MLVLVAGLNRGVKHDDDDDDEDAEKGAYCADEKAAECAVALWTLRCGSGSADGRGEGIEGVRVDVGEVVGVWEGGHCENVVLESCCGILYVASFGILCCPGRCADCTRTCDSVV